MSDSNKSQLTANLVNKIRGNYQNSGGFVASQNIVISDDQVQVVAPVDNTNDNTQAVSSNQTPVDSNDNNLDNLNTFGEVVDELSQAMPSQAIADFIEDETDTLNPNMPVGGRSAKEKFDASGNKIDAGNFDVSGGVQVVETEPNPEIPPEVESFIQQVENHQNQAPKEIVIADGSNQIKDDRRLPSKPVIVLPLTKKEEEVGRKQGPLTSIRWLVEFGQKIIKMFMGKVIYKPEPEIKSEN